ncbi:TetR-like C-terminal domain-containing protein [Plantibacter sp. Mn2098]|uniref:TetR-like C-terminal domain-containing protein n=1 Tax=Plantibacter sp. Mn2098 TaxID=3395266 RepID=UPI003BC26C21
MTLHHLEPLRQPAVRPAGQGRPRDTSIDARATEAVLELLESAPYSSLTMEAVAAKADTSKPALRRRWKSLPGVVVHTLIEALGPAETPDTGCVHCDLVIGASEVADTFSFSSVTHALPGLLSDLASDPELRELFIREYFDSRRDATRAVFENAISRGEIHEGIDMELTLDLVAAPLYYRAFFGHQPITREVAERSVLSVLNGIATNVWKAHHQAG